MITAVFERSADGNYIGVKVSGHSGFDESGRDIVCAAVSSVMMFAANLLTDEMESDSEVSTENGCFSIKLPNPDIIEYAVLNGLYRHLEQIALQYDGCIELKVVSDSPDV